MNRYQAAAFHFLGSASVLLLIFALVRWVWYPGPLFFAASGANLIGIISAVDVVLGPLIMLIIFVPKKRGLKFDIALVLICQVGFMLYGVWSIFIARPVYIAYAAEQFHVVTANEIDEADLKKAERADYRHLPWFGPVTVGTRQPTDIKKRNDVAFAGLGGMGLQNLPQYYVPYGDVATEVKQQAQPVKTLKKASNEDRKLLSQYQEQTKNPDVLFVPVSSKTRRLFAAIDPKTGMILELL